ncbi:MAG: XrtA-associated tyrosine autokinase [Pseudohaliea sp.]
MSSIIEKALKAGQKRREPAEPAPSTPEEMVSRQPGRPPSPPEAVAGAVQAAARSEASSGAEETAAAPADFDKPVIEIPFEALQAQGFLSPLVPRSRTAEEFRTIKRPLLRNISGRGGASIDYPNLVMVTSALQGDGKTFSSINLAMSIAMEKDKTVLFVDADVVRATAGKQLGVPEDAPGLIDLLTGAVADPGDVILRTNLPDLRVLPAGNASEHATELLASSDMQQLMIELSNRYPDRVIVFDSPPLLLTTEAGVLASFMGQIVFVASADVTPQAAVKEGLEHIGADKMVGVMLNRASRRRSGIFGVGTYGYYGYGQGYAEYGSDRYKDTERAEGSA